MLAPRGHAAAAGITAGAVLLGCVGRGGDCGAPTPTRDIAFEGEMPYGTATR